MNPIDVLRQMLAAQDQLKDFPLDVPSTWTRETLNAIRRQLCIMAAVSVAENEGRENTTPAAASLDEQMFEKIEETHDLYGVKGAMDWQAVRQELLAIISVAMTAVLDKEQAVQLEGEAKGPMFQPKSVKHEVPTPTVSNKNFGDVARDKRSEASADRQREDVAKAKAARLSEDLAEINRLNAVNESKAIISLDAVGVQSDNEDEIRGKWDMKTGEFVPDNIAFNTPPHGDYPSPRAG